MQQTWSSFVRLRPAALRIDARRIMERPMINATTGFVWRTGTGSGAVDAMKKVKLRPAEPPNNPHQLRQHVPKCHFKRRHCPRLIKRQGEHETLIIHNALLLPCRWSIHQLSRWPRSVRVCLEFAYPCNSCHSHLLAFTYLVTRIRILRLPTATLSSKYKSSI